MRWTGMVRRAAISTFLVGHLTCLSVWNMPPCAIKQRTVGLIQYYMLPTGLWQYWGMFAPDPIRSTITLEALAVDAKGMMHSFEFPRMADFSHWQDVPRVRHSKYACIFADAEQVAHREFGARHAARQMMIPSDAYPVTVSLVYKLIPPPAPGQPPLDPMTPPTSETIQTYRFDSPEDIQP